LDMKQSPFVFPPGFARLSGISFCTLQDTPVSQLPYLNLHQCLPFHTRSHQMYLSLTRIFCQQIHFQASRLTSCETNTVREFHANFTQYVRKKTDYGFTASSRKYQQLLTLSRSTYNAQLNEDTGKLKRCCPF